MPEVLREAQNNVEIIGTIKKVSIEEKTSKNTGKPMILGSVLVEVQDGDKIHNINCKLFSFKLKKDGTENGLYKGYKTVEEEYKPGDRVRVNGNLTINEYYNQQGSLISFNEVRGVFFNRLEGEEANKSDKAIATIETVVENMISEMDENGIPTGNLEVDAFTVGYGGSIIPLQNMIIGQNLAQTFQNMYIPGSTGRITMKINNYAVVGEEEVVEQSAGFGSAERVESNIVTEYKNNLEIIGGDLPYMDGVNNYSPQDIEDAHKVRELALQQLLQNSSAPATPQHNGFGTNEPKDLSKEQKDKVAEGLDNMFGADDDMPVF